MYQVPKVFIHLKWAVCGELDHLKMFLRKYQMKKSIIPILSENFNEIKQIWHQLQPQTWSEVNWKQKKPKGLWWLLRISDKFFDVLFDDTIWRCTKLQLLERLRYCWKAKQMIYLPMYLGEAISFSDWICSRILEKFFNK